MENVKSLSNNAWNNSLKSMHLHILCINECIVANVNYNYSKKKLFANVFILNSASAYIVFKPLWNSLLPTQPLSPSCLSRSCSLFLSVFLSFFSSTSLRRAVLLFDSLFSGKKYNSCTVYHSNAQKKNKERTDLR